LAANVYEGMFILDANRFGRDPEGVSGQISAMIENLGGEMLVSRLWEERRLAYPIKGHRKGVYWLTYFRIEGDRVSDLKRQCRISEEIIRSLFLKVEPRIVDALVAHAMSAAPSARAEGEEIQPPETAKRVHLDEDLDDDVDTIDAIEDPED